MKLSLKLVHITLTLLILFILIGSVVNTSTELEIFEESKLELDGNQYEVSHIDQTRVELHSAHLNHIIEINHPLRMKHYGMFFRDYKETLTVTIAFEPFDIEYIGPVNRMIENEAFEIYIRDSYVTEQNQFSGVGVEIHKDGTLLDQKLYILNEKNEYGTLTAFNTVKSANIIIVENKFRLVIYTLILLSLIAVAAELYRAFKGWRPWL